GDAAYRVPARAVPRGSLPPAPTELVALSPLRQPSRWLPIAPRWTRAVGWVLVMQAIVSLAWLGEPVFVLTALAFTPLLAGSFHHRSIRVDPLRAAGITATPRL